MNPIDIYIDETAGISRTSECVKFGVPVKKSELFKLDRIAVINVENNEAVMFQAQPTATWSDSSIKWFLLEFMVDVDNDASAHYQIISVDQAKANPHSIKVSERENAILIDTGVARFEVNKQTLTIIKHDLPDQDSPSSECSCTIEAEDSSQKHFSPSVSNISFNSSPNKLRLTIEASGNLVDDKLNMLIAYESRISFFLEHSHVEVEFCIHNPNAAAHPGGLWDLGDQGSIYFKELSANIRCPAINELTVKQSANSKWRSYDEVRSLTIYQDSSGGENWKSNNHKNRKGHVTNTFKGYKIFADGKVKATGDRATPFVSALTEKGRLTCYIKHFWQNFPTAIEVVPDAIQLKLFPSNYADLFELQPGEKKTQIFYLSFADDQTDLDRFVKPLLPRFDAGYWERSQVIPYFYVSDTVGMLDPIIEEGLTGEHNFFEKREVIDEYGWHNFGEIYADHETLYQKDGELPYISHYNNQYDPIYGFARQYAMTGDARWFELMDDLARHVVDIDIYHTNGDRVEYNNGLFWHTDHYLDAHTCTHRTYSKHNATSSIEGQTGGGPGAEHCYTTGLMYHYYIAGNKDSYAAVLKLANWMINIHEGSFSLLAQLLSIKKNELAKIKQLIKGANLVDYKYPLTRGTGNYITALLDAYQLTNDSCWLLQTERVIKETLHPNDNVSERELLNFEVSWSYVVFLRALVKYLFVKYARNEYDEHYFYARDSFLTYAKWMLENERPYLDNDDVLEFPNDTWVAQEIRKVNLLHYASLFEPDPSWQQSYIKRAQELLDYTGSKLIKSNTKYFSRIQIILLQNYESNLIFICNKLRSEFKEYSKSDYGKPPVITMLKLASSAMMKLSKAIKKTSIKNEIDWVKTRM